MSKQQQLYHLTLALSGMLQASKLVCDFSRQGRSDEAAFETSIQSIYCLESDSVESIYGGREKLRIGLNAAIQLLGPEKINSDRDIARYLIRLLQLEYKLNRTPQMQKQLAERIKRAVAQAKYFSGAQHIIINGLADIYTCTLGNLPLRLHIVGHPDYLGRTEVLNKIRATLLAGVRSAVLWRQMGGSRLRLVWLRGKLLATAKEIVSSI
jgi:high frequency lysogenization protein